MTFEAWIFSAKRAWQDPWIKGVSLGTGVIVLLASIWFCAQIFRLRSTSTGLLVLHYNVYTGIDAIRPWGWGFLLPCIWLLVTLVDMAWAFGVYREDAYQAWAFVLIAAGWSIPWIMTLWHLVRMNS